MKGITLSNSDLVAIVDDSDFLMCSEHKWWLVEKDDLRYVVTCIKDNTCSMHKLILGKPPKNKTIDHVNHNGLDNRRSNLRFLTLSEQGHNRKIPAKGYYKDTFAGKWRARINIDGTYHNLGYYDSEEDARSAYLAVKNFFYPNIQYVQ